MFGDYKIKCFAFIVFTLFLTSFTVALDFNIDNYKLYDPERGERGEIQIWDKGQIGDDKKLAEYRLTSNSDKCFIDDCFASGEITLYANHNLLDELKFMNNRRSYIEVESPKIYLIEEVEYTFTYPLYKPACKETINGTECSYVIDRIDSERRIEERLVEYTGQTLDGDSSGITYKWKIEGRLPRDMIVDWGIEMFGLDSFEEWEWWNTSYDFRRNVTGLNVSLPLPLNGTTALDLDENGNIEWIYGTGGPDAAIYYNNENDTRIANDSTQFRLVQTKPIEQSKGTIPENLTFWLPFDDTGSVFSTNFGTNGHNSSVQGTIIRGITNPTGEMFGGYLFNNTPNSFMNATDSPFDGAKGPFIIWMRPTEDSTFSPADPYRIFTSNDGATWIFAMNNNVGADSFKRFRVGGTDIFTDESPFIWGANESFMLTVTWDTDVDHYQMFQNATNVSTWSTAAAGGTDTDRLWILANTGGADYNFDGDVYDIKFFNYALNISDVTQLYDLATILQSQEENPIANVTVDLKNPPNQLATINTTLQFEGNVSVVGANITNATFYIWQPDGSIFVTNTTFITGLSNITFTNVTNLDIGDNYMWNLFGCANTSTDNFCNFATSNRSFNISAFTENSQTFNTPTIIGATESFEINITTGGAHTVTGSLVYNLTNATVGTRVGDDTNGRYSKDIVIDSDFGGTNSTFYWQFAFTNSTSTRFFNSSTQTQTVNDLQIDNCTTFTNVIFNFTVVNEELQTFLPSATLETAINIFDESRENLIINFSNSQTNPATFCLDSNLTANSSFSLDTIVKYDEPVHALEFYNIVNFSLTNNTQRQDITLFDLNISDSTEFQLTFTGSDFLPVENALVFVDRQYISENVFKTVELPKTDSNGQAVLHLVRNDVIYNIIISKNGIILGTFNNIVAFCQDFTIGQCEIILNAFESTQQVFDYDTSIGVIFAPVQFNSTTNVVSVDFVTTDGAPKTLIMEVMNSDIFGNRSLCNDTLVSSSGSLSCTVSSSISDSNLRTNVFVDTKLVSTNTVQTDTRNYGEAGYLVFFVTSIALVLIFSQSKTFLLIGILLSFVVAVGLGMTSSSLIGTGAAGVWLIIILILAIWKLNKDTQP